MPQSFKDDLIEKINSIPEEAFRNKVNEPIEFIKEPDSELEKFRSLERLVQKFENAIKHNSTIQFNANK